jgi:hypothetical protein
LPNSTTGPAHDRLPYKLSGNKYGAKGIGMEFAVTKEDKPSSSFLERKGDEGFKLFEPFKQIKPF